MTVVCNACNIEKPIHAFAVTKRGLPYKQCKMCRLSKTNLSTTLAYKTNELVLMNEELGAVKETLAETKSINLALKLQVDLLKTQLKTANNRTKRSKVKCGKLRNRVLECDPPPYEECELPSYPQ